MGILVGLVLGLLLALLVDRIDTRLRRREEVEAAYRLPVVAEVPHPPGGATRAAVAVLSDPVGPVAEAYRSLRTALTMLPSRASPSTRGDRPRSPSPSRTTRGPQVVLVTSARAGEGKSTTAANLAATLAESGKRVLVVDADFRNPSMHRLFDVSAGAGLANLLTLDRSAPTDLGALARLTDVPNIRVLTAGTPTSSAAECRTGSPPSSRRPGSTPTRWSSTPRRSWAAATPWTSWPTSTRWSSSPGSAGSTASRPGGSPTCSVAPRRRCSASSASGAAPAPRLLPRLGSTRSSGSRRRRRREEKSATGAGPR